MDLELDNIDDLKRYLNEIEKLENDELTDEIIELKNDINEMIKLKSDELMEQRRSVLLSKLEDMASKESCEDVGESIGSVVSVNFTYNNGSFGPRNAVIIDRLYKDNMMTYKVIYSNPIYANEQPCKYVMNTNICDIESCRFNHGVEIDSDKVFPPLNCPLAEGVTCLVKLHTDNLWTRGKIMHIDPEQDTFVVELIDRGGKYIDHTYNVNRHQIVGHKDSSLDVSDKSSDDDSDAMITQMFTSTSQPKDSFGHWEAHTRGIGMKLLMKMGYRIGDGLGANNQGRVSPVRIAENLKHKKHTKKAQHKIKETVLPVVDHESISGIKTALVRNHDKITSIRDNIDQLEKVKNRNNCERNVIRAADDRIRKLKLKLADLEGSERSLMKKRSNKCPKKKLCIF